MREEARSKEQLLAERVSLREEIAVLREREAGWLRLIEQLRESEARHRDPDQSSLTHPTELTESGNGRRSADPLIRAVLEQSPTGILLLSLEGRIQDANRAARDLLGYTWSELVQLELDQLAPPDESDGFQQILDELRTGASPHYEQCQPMVRKDGSHVWTFFTVTPVHDATGDLHCYVMHLLDVTAHIEAEERERESQRRNEEQARLTAMGQLAAGVAHDFNNRLTGIMGNAQMILTVKQAPEQVHRDAQLILEEGQRAAQLIRQLLGYAKKTLLQRSRLDLRWFLARIRMRLERTLPESICVGAYIPEGTFVLDADEQQLEQVLMNLASNARDAMPEGGHFRVMASAFVLGQGMSPPFPEMCSGDWVMVVVQDTGVGIPEDVLSHIYEPFFTTKSLGTASGLRLSQAYGIIAQHGGFMSVRSVPGEGTTFRIFLPALELRVRPAPPTELFEPSGKGESVLLVEDDPMVLRVLGRMLEVLGYRPIVAQNGQEALARLCDPEMDIEIVLSDVVMSKMGGVELYHQLARLGHAAKIVLISGYPLGEEDLPAGIDGWIQKPPTMRRLSQVLQEVLNP